MPSVKKQFRNEVPPVVASVLSVSQLEADHAFLETTFANRDAWTQYTDCKWVLHRTATIPSSLRLLRQKQVHVILCERDIPGTWRELSAELTPLHHPPFLIVTSQFADDRLWANALSLGAWDVLAKPFDAGDLIRVVSIAWQHWLKPPSGERTS